MKISNIAIELIKPYWRNARDNSNTIEALKKSITEYGFNQPLVLDKGNTIIVGHARYKAMLELGEAEIPCIVVEMDAKKAKQYRIADNKTHEMTSWIHKDLLIELRDLGDWQDIDFFFPDIDVDSLLNESIGQSMKDITDAQIESQFEKNNHAFEVAVQEATNDQVLIMCPHCADEFYVSKHEVLRRIQLGTNDKN